jgi:hypothetical protein
VELDGVIYSLGGYQYLKTIEQLDPHQENRGTKKSNSGKLIQNFQLINVSVLWVQMLGFNSLF